MTTEPKPPAVVIHWREREKHQRVVYIGRENKQRGWPASPFGNPFMEGKDGTRAEVIEKFRGWLFAQPELVTLARETLGGCSLACWCSPKPCHGDILAAIANDQGEGLK